jgi:hypothetical protein
MGGFDSEGDVVLKRLQLYPSNKAGEGLDIQDIVHEFEIYMSMDNQTMQAKIWITDDVNILQNFPIVGEEELEIHIQTDDDFPLLKFDFLVEKIIDSHTNERGDINRYCLVCVTKDYLKNSFSLFTRRYRDLTYKDALSICLYTDLGTSRPLVTVEETKGFFDYMVNRVRPFQVIDIIRERATSATNKSSLFFFYEDNLGYHFTTMEKKIEDNKGQAENYKFFYDQAQQHQLQTVDWYSILEFRQLGHGDSIDKVRAGGMRNVNREFDIHNGAFVQSWEYNNPQDGLAFKKPDKPHDYNSAQYNTYVTEKPAVDRLSVKDGSRKTMLHNENQPMMTPYKWNLDQHVLRLRINGNTKIDLGYVIQVVIPQMIGSTGTKEEHKLLTGNYVVKSIKHSISRGEDNNWGHITILDCRKTSLFEAV